MSDDRDMWPRSDRAVMALLERADPRVLHAFMCDCAEHAWQACVSDYRAAGFTSLPDLEPIAIKRRWLLGQASDQELREAQSSAVGGLYWGHPLELGAAVLGAAWQPGAALSLAIDEQYAERMTDFESASEAACEVMHEAARAVVLVAFNARWTSQDTTTASVAAQRAEAAEIAWQRRHLATLVRQP